MPLGATGTRHQGPPVERYFENLLPDSRQIRQRLGQRFEAKSDHAFDLLAETGRDCVGAIQLTQENKAPKNVRRIEAEPIVGSSQAERDRLAFFKTQLLFWALCAVDGHAKNFSIFLTPQGAYQLTPRYDVLSAYPVLSGKASQLPPHRVNMAMAVPSGKRRHHNWDSINYRRWQRLAKCCGIAGKLDPLTTELRDSTPAIIEKIRGSSPPAFPPSVAEPILEGLAAAMAKLVPSVP